MDRILSRPGKFGTLHLYSVKYDQSDPGFVPDDWHTYAYSPEHAEEKFYDSSSDETGDGHRVMSVARVRNTSANRSR